MKKIEKCQIWNLDTPNQHPSGELWTTFSNYLQDN